MAKRLSPIVNARPKKKMPDVWVVLSFFGGEWLPTRLGTYLCRQEAEAARTMLRPTKHARTRSVRYAAKKESR